MIHFEKERYEELRKTYDKWWNKELDRPVSGIVVREYDPGRPCPASPYLCQATCTDFSVSPEELIDRLDYDYSQYAYYGDAFPYFNMDCFGPGVVATFLGATLDNSSGQVWFHPKEDLPIEDIHLEYDPENPIWNRVKAIYRAGMERWEGRMMMGMPDLGGVMDVLSTFRLGERLLLDLIDKPQEVRRLVGEISALWRRYYQELSDLINPQNNGYTDWSGIYSRDPSYILQCDFSYMIGPEMFMEFVYEELASTCRWLTHPAYHLDGPGALRHLPALLSIPELRCIQWVPGDGNKPCVEWPEVYRQIADAGKLIHIPWRPLEECDQILKDLGDNRHVYIPPVYVEPQDRAYAEKYMRKFGVL